MCDKGTLLVTKEPSLVAKFHLPGLYEFYEFYKVFLPLFYENREYFYDWAEIASIYGAPADCIWGGGRISDADVDTEDVLCLLSEYGISARLTFSNSLIRNAHLADRKCNMVCRQFNESNKMNNGVIVHSDLLLDYLKEKYPNLYFVSSTTKVQTCFDELKREVNREEFSYVVPDFRLNKALDQLNTLSVNEKKKIEFLCNECCFIGCNDRKKCYENVSRKILGEDCDEHICRAPGGQNGYLFSDAMKNPAFISKDDIVTTYLPQGFTNFKIEGRGLGSALILEFILYYMVKPEYQLIVREKTYLSSMLDLF